MRIRNTGQNPGSGSKFNVFGSTTMFSAHSRKYDYFTYLPFNTSTVIRKNPRLESWCLDPNSLTNKKLKKYGSLVEIIVIKLEIFPYFPHIRRLYEYEWRKFIQQRPVVSIPVITQLIFVHKKNLTWADRFLAFCKLFVEKFSFSIFYQFFAIRRFPSHTPPPHRRRQLCVWADLSCTFPPLSYHCVK